MNLRGISFYLSLFCFPVSFLAFINILYASYFDYFLSIDTYFTTLLISLTMGVLVFLLKFLNIENQLLLLIIQICSGITIYILLCYFTKLESFMNILNLIRSKSKFL